MKEVALIIFTFICLSGCKQKYKPRVLTEVEIEEFSVINSSIRAIHAKDSLKVFYAGSRGNVGFKTYNNNDLELQSIVYSDTLLPHFRGVAFNGENYFVLSIGNPALMYKIYSDKFSLVYKEEHENVFYDAITFFEDNIHGIAVGDATENCASILTTKNGGETWQKTPCSQLPILEEGEAFFAASNTNIKTLGSTVWIASGGKKARIFKSSDYGNSWQVYNTPIIHGNGPQGIYSIDFYDDKSGIIIGGNYAEPKGNKANKAITKDGGESWQLVSNERNPNYKSAVQYVPDTDGKEIFAVGKTGISFSNNGGKSWVNVSSKGFYAITFTDKNTAWLSGANKIGKMALK
ncbi:oxidoreductase [Polaribacter sp.]|uniref:sialidase family protein n=1 Tax=Polaribacter sp. TaxID=1920175 RepID=UPI0025E1B1FC|nr:oxidoreductase [Polaribacter sp.]